MTGKRRFLILATKLFCDVCKNNIPDLEHGYYTCDHACNYDVCMDCYYVMLNNAEDKETDNTRKAFKQSIAKQKETMESLLSLS